MKQNFLEIVNLNIQEKKFRELKTLLENTSILLEEIEQNWESSPLVKLIESGVDSDEKVELFKKLVERGARLDVISSGLNWNLLHYLVKLPEMETEIREVNDFEKKVINVILVKQPSLVNEKDAHGYTPLAYTIENAKSNLVSIFISRNETDLNVPLISPKLLERYEKGEDIFGVTEIADYTEKQKYELKKQQNLITKFVYPSDYAPRAVDLALKHFDEEVIQELLKGVGWTRDHIYKVASNIFNKVISEGGNKNYKRVFEALHAKDKLGFYKAMHQYKMDILDMAIKRSDFTILENVLVGSKIGSLNYFTKTQLENANKGRDLNNYVVKIISDFCKQRRNISVQLEEKIFERNTDIDVYRLLIENNVDVNYGNDNGKTPLHFAVEYGRLEIVELLLANGADVNAKKVLGSTPLHFAVEYGRLEIVKLLLANGADVNAKDMAGSTSLHFAVEDGHLEIVELLLANGADVNAKDIVGSTPLHRADKIVSKEIVELLLANGADANAKNNDGNSLACMIVKLRNNSPVVVSDRLAVLEVLFQKGAKLIDEEAKPSGKHFVLKALYNLNETGFNQEIINLIVKTYESRRQEWREFFKFDINAKKDNNKSRKLKDMMEHAKELCLVGVAQQMRPFSVESSGRVENLEKSESVGASNKRKREEEGKGLWANKVQKPSADKGLGL